MDVILALVCKDGLMQNHYQLLRRYRGESNYRRAMPTYEEVEIPLCLDAQKNCKDHNNIITVSEITPSSSAARECC